MFKGTEPVYNFDGTGFIAYVFVIIENTMYFVTPFRMQSYTPYMILGGSAVDDDKDMFRIFSVFSHFS